MDALGKEDLLESMAADSMGLQGQQWKVSVGNRQILWCRRYSTAGQASRDLGKTKFMEFDMDRVCGMEKL